MRVGGVYVAWHIHTIGVLASMGSSSYYLDFNKEYSLHIRLSR